MTDEAYPKTLYVGNLDQSVTEDLICALFGQMGPVKGCKIIREPGYDPYAFVEFSTHQAAATALSAMNKRLFLDKEMKVNWATSPGNQPKTDTSQHHHIFVGDLSPEIETDTLREAFAPFGEISNCRIVRDPQTLKSKGYAFVSFVKKAEAENAIQTMNGQWLGSRSIRTNWSTRKPPAPRDMNMKAGGIGGLGGLKAGIGLSGLGVGGGLGGVGGLGSGKTPGYDEIYNQTSPTNTTVYCGGFPSNIISDELMHKHFGQFGPIHDIRVFKDKGYAFIKFTTKDAATHAIEGTHNSEVQGHPVKCFWGKENGGEMGTGGGGGVMNNILQQHQHQQQQQQHQQNPNQQLQPGGAQYPYSYQQMGYWYPSYPAQMQAQYMQQSAYYPYAYATASPQQQGAGAGYRMMQPATNMAASWGMPSVGNSGLSALGQAAAGTTPQMMYATMQQFQTQ